MTGAKVDREQLIQVIEGVEARGEDVTELRHELEALGASSNPTAQISRARREGDFVMEELSEEELAQDRVPIPYTPVKRLIRDDILYVMEVSIPHPIEGYFKAHEEYSVIDLRGYRKGYEPRLDIQGIYTPNPTDTFRMQTGRLPAYQPTMTGDKLLAEMRKLGVYKAYRIAPHSSNPASSVVDEEYLEEMRSKSSIEYGTDLECMMCHDKFDHLVSGTCEVCFREWMLPLKPKTRTRKLL